MNDPSKVLAPKTEDNIIDLRDHLIDNLETLFGDDVEKWDYKNDEVIKHVMDTVLEKINGGNVIMLYTLGDGFNCHSCDLVYAAIHRGGIVDKLKEHDVTIILASAAYPPGRVVKDALGPHAISVPVFAPFAHGEKLGPLLIGDRPDNVITDHLDMWYTGK
jgi:hypothetical protein